MVTDDSYLAVARLLRSLLGALGEDGSYLGGKEMSRVLQDGTGAKGVVYGPKTVAVHGGSEYELAIGQNVSSRSEWPDRRHPDGKYR